MASYHSTVKHKISIKFNFICSETPSQEGKLKVQLEKERSLHFISLTFKHREFKNLCFILLLVCPD